MVKRTVSMPDDEVKQGNYPIVPVGEHRFQITDVKEEENKPDYVAAICEVISDVGNGLSVRHRLTLNPDDKFFWLTRLFLKAIDEPCRGEVQIDTDSWIGRQLIGRVEHNGKYANIREIIFKEGEEYQQPVKLANNGENQVNDPKDIQWEN